MAQARQIIGRKPNGTPIYGPPTSAPPVNASFERLWQPQAEVTVGAPMDVLSLQPSVPDAPQRGVVDTVRDGVSALKDWVSQDGIFGVARKVAQAVLPAMIDGELDRAGRLVEAAKNFSVGNSVRAVGARAVPWMRDVAQGASEITGEQLGSALNTFVKNVAGADYELVKPDGQPLSQHQGLEWAALGAAALLPIGPGGKANLAKKGINAGVDAAKALRARGAEVAAAANAKLAASLGKAPAPPFSHLERAPVDINDEGRMFVSTRVPTSVKGQVKADAPLNTGLDEVLQDPELVRTFAAKIRGSQAQPDGSPGIPYNLLTDAQLRGSDEQVVRSFMDTGANNIRYMIDQMEKGGWAQFSREWYDGANVVTGNLARAYRVDPNASTGVVAVLSPQKDWHQNAEMAKRVIKNQQDFGRTNPTFDRDVFDHYRVTSTDALTDSLKQQLREKRITPVTAEWIMQAHPFYLDKYKKSVVGARWQDLTPDDQAIYLRAYDELVNGQRYPVLAPNGSVAHEFAITGSGEEAKMSWQSYGAIKKALSILNDPTVENISKNLGNEHKVRAFFDNMSRPEWGRIPGQRGPSTVDTHQVAASHLMPYGAASPVVKYTMGGASNNTLGLSGMNPLYQEMLTEAVKGNPNDYLPRAGQSVSWDGIKSLFSPEQKRDKMFVAKITGLWTEYQQGRMSLKGVQDAVTNEAGGIKPPEWAKRK